MSVVVGVEGDQYVAMAGDHFWGHQDRSICKTQPKVFRKPLAQHPSIGEESTEMLIGVTGRPRVSQLLRFHFNAPTREHGPLVYLTGSFVTALKSLFHNHGILKEEHEVQEVYESSILVGIEGGIYQISNNFQVTRAEEGYMAIGVGYKFAYGALASMDEELTPDTRATRAVRATAQHCPTVEIGEGPITQEVLPVQ